MPSWLASFSQNIFQNNFQKYIKEKREVQERFENRLKQNFKNWIHWLKTIQRFANRRVLVLIQNKEMKRGILYKTIQAKLKLDFNPNSFFFQFDKDMQG
jgi:hypothetical protein